MIYPIFLIIGGGVIVYLLHKLQIANRLIEELQRTLKEERQKRSMPMLTMEVNTERDHGVFLINDSYCYAKNIHLQNLDVVVDYGFKKHITLKFGDVETLKPNGRVKLNYRVFDGEYDVTTQDAKNILNHFPDSPIEAHLSFENLEGAAFISTIIPGDNGYTVKEVVPA